MNPEAESKLARITELLAQRDQIISELEQLLLGKPEELVEPEPEPTVRRTNKGHKISSPPKVAPRPYKCEDVERDIVAGMKAKEIAARHGIEPSDVYGIKSKMKRAGVALPVQAPKPAGLTGDMIEQIQDLRSDDHTTTEIADMLGLTFDQVSSVLARGALGAVGAIARKGRLRKDPIIHHNNRIVVSLDDDEDGFGADDDD